MIIERMVKGSKQTSWHDFKVTQIGMSIVFSYGSYYRAGDELIHLENDSVLNIPISEEKASYEVWLTEEGFSVTANEEDNIPNKIDRLAWFTVPEGADTLDHVAVEVVKIVD